MTRMHRVYKQLGSRRGVRESSRRSLRESLLFLIQVCKKPLF